jgi:hypothetical protein
MSIRQTPADRPAAGMGLDQRSGRRLQRLSPPARSSRQVGIALGAVALVADGLIPALIGLRSSV